MRLQKKVNFQIFVANRRVRENYPLQVHQIRIVDVIKPLKRCIPEGPYCNHISTQILMLKEKLILTRIVMIDRR